MQGYILNMQKSRAEDLIVRILTPTQIKTLYRFYGTRHSIINLGRKIDFEEEKNLTFLPKLKHILHLAHKWENDKERYYVWQRFIALLNKHLSDVYTIEEFYFQMLENGANKLNVQNPKRVAIEMYAQMLAFEGRINQISHQYHQDTNHNEQHLCFICGEQIHDEIALGRAFLFAHHSCIGGEIFDKAKILSFLQTQSSIHLEDDEVLSLWEILGLGM